MDMEINVVFICWYTKYFLIILVLIVGMGQLADGTCPHICECKWKNGKESVQCLNVNLTRIPIGLDTSTQVLDITGNDVTEIEHDAFSNAGLLNLQKIFIAKCRLKFLHRFSFRNLINLVDLDLSYNTLGVVPTYTFDSIFELRELKLSGNPIQKVKDNAFMHLAQLVRLELSDCRIAVVEPLAFAGLDVLEWLKLDGNKLTSIQFTSFRSLQNLKGIELARNWWNCSCQMKPVRAWMMREKISYTMSPICRSPPRLSNKLWNNLDLDEFVCPPEIFATNNSNRYTARESMNVTISCHIGEGAGEHVEIKWMLRNKIVSNYTANALMAMSSSSANRHKSYVVKNSPWMSNLTVLGADIHDTGIYTCFVKNKAGQAESHAYLNIVKADSVHILYSHFVIIFMVILILIITVMVVAVYIWYKGQKKHYNWNLKKDKTSSYEKIELSYHENNPHGRPTADNGAAMPATDRTTTLNNSTDGDDSARPTTFIRHNNNNNNDHHRKNGIAILQDAMSSSSLPFESQFYSPIKRNGFNVPAMITSGSPTTNDDDFTINEENFYYSIKGDGKMGTNYRKPIENFQQSSSVPPPPRSLSPSLSSSPTTPMTRRPDYTTWQQTDPKEIDLHIPRLSDKKWADSSINVRTVNEDLITWSSTANQQQYNDTKGVNISSYLLKKLASKDLRDSSRLYSTEESSFMNGDAGKTGTELEFPDLLNTTASTSRCYKSDIYCIDDKLENDVCKNSNSGRTNSNSISNINSNAFFTLPRKQAKNSYKKYLKTISDSQSSSLVPLSSVAGSTSSLNKYCNSNSNLFNLYLATSNSGIASVIPTVTTLPRRFSIDTYVTKTVIAETDGSNLTKSTLDEDGKPLSCLATPLLDFTTLESYQKIASTAVTTSAKISSNPNPYTCKPTSELDSFLEEYQNLQSQLYKMKEACNVIQQQKDEQAKFNQLSTLLQNTSKSIRPLEESSPDVQPYWMQRNEMLKRKQDGSFYQS